MEIRKILNNKKLILIVYGVLGLATFINPIIPMVTKYKNTTFIIPIYLIIVSVLTYVVLKFVFQQKSKIYLLITSIIISNSLINTLIYITELTINESTFNLLNELSLEETKAIFIMSYTNLTMIIIVVEIVVILIALLFNDLLETDFMKIKKRNYRNFDLIYNKFNIKLNMLQNKKGSNQEYLENLKEFIESYKKIKTDEFFKEKGFCFSYMQRLVEYRFNVEKRNYYEASHSLYGLIRRHQNLMLQKEIFYNIISIDIKE